MSAQHATGDADAPEDARHDIIPDDFVASWNETVDREITTVAEALAVAEAAPPDTDPDDHRLCPACLSRRIRHKPGRDMAHKRDGNFKCTNCTSHFNSPLPSRNDAFRDAAHAPDADAEVLLPQCPHCGSRALYPVPKRAVAVETRWVCEDCTARFNVPHRQATLGEVDG